MELTNVTGAASALGISGQWCVSFWLRAVSVGRSRWASSWVIPAPVQTTPGRRGPDGSARPKRSLETGLDRKAVRFHGEHIAGRS